MDETENICKIGVVGSGFIGRSWAMLYAGAGYKVSIFDESQTQVKSAILEIKTQLDFLKSKNILRGNLSAEEQFQLISPAATLAECIQGAFYIQECVFERVEVKHAVFKQIDSLVTSNDVILASSTSCIAPADFTHDLVHRNQVVVAHPVNPPYYAPMVEMVASPWTLDIFFQQTRQLMIEIGQKPMTVKKHIYGFVSNRIQYSIINESWRLIEDGILSVEDLDTVMSEGLGMLYAFAGPLETAALEGNGFIDFCERHAEDNALVCSTMGPVPYMAGEMAQKVQDELSAKVPPNKLTDRRRWRDNCLIALSKLKNE